MKPGGQRRIKVPAQIVEEGAPAGRPAVGDLLMTVELISVAEAIPLHDAADFEGEPLATSKRPDGLTIYDYALGEGRLSKPGDQVVTHYVGQLLDGTVFDTSHARTEGMPVVIGGGGVIKGFGDALEGVRPGMLRKAVIPPELGYGDRDQGKIPPNSTLVFLLQIMEVKDGPVGGQAPIDIPIPKPAADRDKPGAEKPEGDKPAKPPKPPKPAKPADGE
jgi:peptidylprolyl isomerase